MQPTKLVPNSIGRLDDIVAKIRQEDYKQAEELLSQEVDRLEQQVSVANQEYLQKRLRLVEVSRFAGRFIGSHEFRQECTREVGG